MKEMSFVPACKDFFGFKHGQSLGEFMTECKALSPEDREEIKAGLEANGYNIKS